jgi:hypothetical protein
MITGTVTAWIGQRKIGCIQGPGWEKLPGASGILSRWPAVIQRPARAFRSDPRTRASGYSPHRSPMAVDIELLEGD